ncbi:MAG: hypothetical protein ABL879_04600 [Devosia sp.]
MTMPLYRPRAWHLIFVALFGLFELGVAWLALHPTVADDYRAYYIDRTSSCYPRADTIATGYYPLGEPVAFTPGRNGFARDTLRSCGLMAANAQGLRSFGDYGILKFRFTVPDDDLLFTLTTSATVNKDDPPRKIFVEANGTDIGSYVLRDSKPLFTSFVIPREVVAANSEGGVDIRLKVPRTGPPGTNKEPVTLQLRVETLRLVAARSAPPAATTPVAGGKLESHDGGPKTSPKTGAGWTKLKEAGTSPASSNQSSSDAP